MTARTGVVLMTFGSAVTGDDVPAYLASVRAGRAVPDDVIAEFKRRYAVIGRSPLIDITRAQADALQTLLDATEPDAFRVAFGMLHSDPRLAGAVDGLVRDGVARIVAIVLAPQYSPIILAGYEREIAAARERHRDVEIRIAPAWHLSDGWIDSLAERLGNALGALAPEGSSRIPIVFTAHSLPRAVVDRDPGYIEQLRDTAACVAQRLHLPADRWRFAYQSAGHTPEEWLTPDLNDVLPTLRDEGHHDVLVVPLQFLADHLEILYDIDVAARQQAESAEITLHRIELPNTSPTFIAALAQVVKREIAFGRASTL